MNVYSSSGGNSTDRSKSSISDKEFNIIQGVKYDLKPKIHIEIDEENKVIELNE